ncbi:MAG: glycosyltransferase [Chloroflexi bacterium]|nr:glycosyltransferase [Chloroflexota bacterium]
MNPRPRISVVIPTHNGAATLPACLQSLRSSSLPPHELIVVDDCSSDGSAEIAQQFQCCIVRLDENIGAARARNRGAQTATGDVLFFTDDDVIVAPDALAQVAEDLSAPLSAGVVGLPAREIPFHNFASHYKNLWMRFTYLRLPRERIGVFDTTVAAIRRQVFLELGGFDENYSGASIAEDTEFGQRAWAAGHMLVSDPQVAVTHCKHYTLSQVLSTDFLRARALMLMRLRKWGQPFFTSVPLFYQLAVPVIFAAVFAGPFVPLLSVVLFAAFYALNASWLAYLARERGPRFALCAALFQPIDVLAVGAGMLAAMIDFVRGVRY